MKNLTMSGEVTTKYCDMSNTMLMRLIRIAKWALKSEKENRDISKSIRDKLEEMFGGTWMAVVGSDFSTSFSSSRNDHVQGTLAHISVSKNNELEVGVMVYQCPKQN